MNRYRLLLLLFCLILAGCSSSDTVLGGEEGGVTETIGLVVSAKGDPLPDVKIQLVPTNHIPQKEGEVYHTLHSNEKGEFSLKGVVDGEYNLLYQKEGEAAFRDSLSIVDGTVSVMVRDTLFPMSSLSGVVRLHEKHNSEKVFILLRGTNRFLTPLDSTGAFTIDSLAAGEYTITFIADYDYYSQFDTVVTIMRNSAQQFSDTVRMEYLGIEVPVIVSQHYDSSLLSATIRWNAVASEDHAGYQIIRRANHPDSLPVSLAYMHGDTFWVDSCDNEQVVEGKEYLYQVSCMNNHGMSGKPSKTTSVTYESLFETSATMTLDSFCSAEYSAMALYESTTLYLINSDRSIIQKIDLTNLTQSEQLSLPDSCLPTDISLLEDNTLLIASNKGVYNIDTTGKRLWRYSAYGTPQESGMQGYYTRKIAPLDLQYFYYTATTQLFEDANLILRFNCYSGKSDTLVRFENKRVRDFCIDRAQNYIYVLTSIGEHIRIEGSSLESWNPSTIFHGDFAERSHICLNGDGTLSLLAEKSLLTIDIEEQKLLSKTFCSTASIALVSINQLDRVLLNSAGELCKVQRKWPFRFSNVNQKLMN